MYTDSNNEEEIHSNEQLVRNSKETSASYYVTALLNPCHRHQNYAYT